MSQDNEYQKQIQPFREQFANHQVVTGMLDRNSDPKLTELFIIHWTVLSAGLTEPIAKYLKGAGEGCGKLGMKKMADFFLEHAAEEDGHNHWAEDDTHKLVAKWNKRNPKIQLDANDLLAKKFSPAVKRYHQLHEDVVNGSSPYGELAIDVEIELITKQYGPRMMWQCIKKIGPRIIFDMSFLREHVRFDFGHTKHNFEVIDTLLKEHPETLEPLIAAGKGGLETYAGFLEDAFQFSKQKLDAVSSKAA